MSAVAFASHRDLAVRFAEQAAELIEKFRSAIDELDRVCAGIESPVVAAVDDRGESGPTELTPADIEPLRDHLTRLCGVLVRRAIAAGGGSHAKAGELLSLAETSIRNIERNYLAWVASRGETPETFGPHDRALYTASYESAKHRFRIEHVALAVEVCGGSKSKAARLLEVTAPAVYYILKQAAQHQQ